MHHPSLSGSKRAGRYFEPNKPPEDLAIRRRMCRVLDELEGHREPVVLVAAWRDLLDAVKQAHAADDAAARFLSIAAWLGHTPEELKRRVESDLFDGRTPVLDRRAPAIGEALAPRPIQDRLDAIERYLAQPLRRGRAIVWLRYQLARVDSEARGFPVICIGDAVTIYQGDWLRACVFHTEPDRGLPPETAGPDAWTFRMFLGLPQDQEASLEIEPRERPTAYIRIDVGEQVLAGAIDIARANAEALAALGTLYGTEPTLWSLDASSIVFIEGRDAGALTGPAPIVEPNSDQRIAVHRDRTSRQLRGMASKLGPQVPIRDDQLQRATTLLGWLRGARSASSPLKLVLCDRVVESVAGWAGVARPERFIREHLLPWWAYSRIRSQVISVAYALWDYQPTSDGQWATYWTEILAHQPLQLTVYPEATIQLRGVLSETQWLLQRVPPESRPGEALCELDRVARTRTGLPQLGGLDSWTTRRG